MHPIISAVIFAAGRVWMAAGSILLKWKSDIMQEEKGFSSCIDKGE